MVRKVHETDLYPPLERFLKKKGYVVHAEVILSDISAVKDNELLIVEIKTRFNLEVVFQAIHRMAAADLVYIAVPVFDFRKYPQRWKDIRKLCTLLGIGILFVRFIDDREPEVEVALHRKTPSAKKKNSSKSGFLREINERKINFNTGGSTGKPLFTAYRLEALRILEILNKHGHLRPKALRDFGTSSKTGSILRDNYYGWFERESRGLYKVSDTGRLALSENRTVLEKLHEKDASIHD